MSVPVSLQRQALKQVIRLILDEPNLIYKLPVTMRSQIARESYDTLLTFFKKVSRARKRKQLTQKSFATLVNSKEHDVIPKKFKKSNISFKTDMAENATLVRLAAFITS